MRAGGIHDPCASPGIVLTGTKPGAHADKGRIGLALQSEIAAIDDQNSTACAVGMECRFPLVDVLGATGLVAGNETEFGRIETVEVEPVNFTIARHNGNFSDLESGLSFVPRAGSSGHIRNFRLQGKLHGRRETRIVGCDGDPVASAAAKKSIEPVHAVFLPDIPYG